MDFKPMIMLLAVGFTSALCLVGCPFEFGHEIASGVYSVRSDCPGSLQAGKMDVQQADQNTFDDDFDDDDTDDDTDDDGLDGDTTSADSGDASADVDGVDDSSDLSFNEYLIPGAVAFGFPTETLQRGSIESDVVSSSDGTRKCEAKLVEELGDFALFRCSESGELICTITLTKD